MKRTKELRLTLFMPVILGLAACSGQAPADEMETPVKPAENPVAIDSAQATAEQTKATGWCRAQEPALFSCQLKNRKVISVCGTENGAGDKTAQYRFGTLGQSPELVLPEAAGKNNLTFASVPYSGGGEAQIGFSRGDVTYVVYSRMVRTNFEAGEPNYPEMTDGVMVVKGKQTLSDLVCSDPDGVPVDYDLASKYADPSDEAFVIPGE